MWTNNQEMLIVTLMRLAYLPGWLVKIGEFDLCGILSNITSFQGIII
jgi:hypothetical protein